MFFKKKNNIPNVEEQFLDEIAVGNADAFQLLYHKHSQGVYRYCLKILKNEATAKDALQETFIKVYENRESFNGVNFKGWLFTIARNTCMNFQRGKKEYIEYEEGTRPQYQNDDFILREYIQKMIDTLPDSYREAIILREYEELSYEEISKVLDVEVNLVKVRVHLGRKILKKLLEPVVKEINEL